MRERLARVLAAIPTPPHMPANYFNQMKQRFANLERYFPPAVRGKEVSEAIEGITGYYFRDVLWELPWETRGVIEGVAKPNSYHDEPLSKRIAEFQEFSAMKNIERRYIRMTMNALTRLPKDRGAYADFFKAYANFLKEYPDALREMHEIYDEGARTRTLDDFMGKRLTDVSNLFQSYRTSLDAIYKYVMLYLDFAPKVDAFLLRIDLQEEAYFSGQGYPERRQRPPHKGIEVLYHAGTDVTAILAGGFKTRAELGEESAALGGGPDDVISFTADIAIAREIVDALRDVVRIAHGEMTAEDVLGLVREEGIPEDHFENTKRDYAPHPIPEGHEDDLVFQKAYTKLNERRDPRRYAFELYRTYLVFTTKRYNPAFFGVRIENFENVRPENIGILAARVEMSQVTEYLREMEEFRAPKSAILSMKRVPY